MSANSRRAWTALPLVAAIGLACAGRSSPGSARGPRPAPADLRPSGPTSPRIWTDPVDFLALRTEFGDRSDFAEVCERDRPVGEWMRAYQTSDWPTLLDSTQKWLAECPVDIDAHWLSALANRQTGEYIDAAAHAVWFRGLVDSVLGSGSGTSADSPYRVISVDEEYAILRARRLQPARQTLLNGGIDALRTVDADGKESTVYFFPEAHWRRLEKTKPDAPGAQ